MDGARISRENRLDWMERPVYLEKRARLDGWNMCFSITKTRVDGWGAYLFQKKARLDGSGAYFSTKRFDWMAGVSFGKCKKSAPNFHSRF